MEERAADVSAVGAALDRILASEAFVGSARMNRLLRFVVERTLDGRTDEIKEYVLGTEVFDRGADYDPRLDSIVRVEARRLRTKLAEYYAGPGQNDPVLIRIRRGTYVPEFVVPPVAPTAVFAPPAGLANGVGAVPRDPQPARRLDRYAAQNESFVPLMDPHSGPGRAERAEETTRTSQGLQWTGYRGHSPWLVLWTGATLGAVIVAALAAQIVRPPGPTSAESAVPRLAVLPFAHYPPGDSGQALADRMTDGVTTALVRVDRLEIVSRMSASQFAREPRSVGEVARALDADWIVEGTVFAENGAIRAAVRLVDPSRDRKLWAEDFESSLGDLQNLERRIADRVDRAARASRGR